ncbi:MAG: hypothetical protein ACTSRL_20310, partial [Candidatus Helarchaeota archaeon]
MTHNNRDLDSIEDIAKAASDLLDELANLEGLSNSSSVNTDYLNRVKILHTEMKDNILKGIQSENLELFLKGLDYYQKNSLLLKSTGDKRAYEDYQYDMIQFLTDLIVQFRKEINNHSRRQFIIISLQFIAKIYENAQNYPRAIETRLTVSNLLNSWTAAIEYAIIILDFLLLEEIPKAQEVLNRFDTLESKIYLKTENIIEQSLKSKRILNIKEFSESLITGFQKNLPIFFQDAQEFLDQMDFTDNFAFSQMTFLFQHLLKKHKIQDATGKEPPPSPTTT